MVTFLFCNQYSETMLKHTCITGFLIFLSVFVYSQGSSKFGLVIGPGIASDINNLSIKYEPAFAFKTGVFILHPINQKLSISGESGYLKTGFKGQIYNTFSGATPTGRDDYYSVRYHKLYAVLGIKMPLSKKKERFFILPGLSLQYLLNHELINGSSSVPDHFNTHIENFRSVQVYANLETGIEINEFILAIVLAPQLLNNVLHNGNLRMYSYFCGLCLRMPIVYY